MVDATLEVDNKVRAYIGPPVRAKVLEAFRLGMEQFYHAFAARRARKRPSVYDVDEISCHISIKTLGCYDPRHVHSHMVLEEFIQHDFSTKSIQSSSLPQIRHLIIDSSNIKLLYVYSELLDVCLA